ncbi:hypothetical protein C2S52_014077 [Perilla frutescens var. hirtella]|nr:hypothetical protein C2S52_014077 [Perilla frutescens var. hirtella]
MEFVIDMMHIHLIGDPSFERRAVPVAKPHAIFDIDQSWLPWEAGRTQLGVMAAESVLHSTHETATLDVELFTSTVGFPPGRNADHRIHLLPGTDTSTYFYQFVSRNYFSVDKRRRLFRVGSLRWFSGSPPTQITQLQCKVQHGPGLYSCNLTIEVDRDGHEIGVVKISEDDQGLTAGQFATFYQGSTCIGSSVILESWDDQGFPVCAKGSRDCKNER